ncbi:hypothetical protein [Streptomyces sp. YIM S03343]
MTEQQPWGPNTIARYLTVAGATVDLTHQLGGRLSQPEPVATLATCTGCPDSQQYSHWFGSGSEADGTYTEAPDEARATRQARIWAQDHAATCRALPKPEAAR